MNHDPEQRHEKIAGIIERWCAGEFSEIVFAASLKAQGMRRDNINALVSRHRAAFVESFPYKRGDVR